MDVYDLLDFKKDMNCSAKSRSDKRPSSGWALDDEWGNHYALPPKTEEKQKEKERQASDHPDPLDTGFEDP